MLGECQQLLVPGSLKSTVQTVLLDLCLLIHPDLHCVSSTILRRLKALGDIREFTQWWWLYFTGIAVINNQQTPNYNDTVSKMVQSVDCHGKQQ